MNFYDHYMKYLQERGLFEQQAKAILQEAMNGINEMKDRWFDSINGYPPTLTNIINLYINDYALQYIKEKCPNAWFRPIFDKEHPLHKEAEVIK